MLGEDFIRHFKRNFDHDGRQIVIYTIGISHESDTVNQRVNRLACVVSTDALEIPPGCEVSVLARFKYKPVTSDGVLAPDSGFIVKHGLMLTRCVVSSEQSRFCARILNQGKCTVSIQKGTVIRLLNRFHM